MHERNPVSNTCEANYNLDGSVEFRIGHRFRCREAVLQGVKNYSIRRSVEYRVIKSDRLKEVRRFGGPHNCLASTMSQDHRQLDSSLICRVILPLIQSNPSVSIPVLQGMVQASYHFKPSYIKVWMVKQKAIARIYGDWEESYNKVPKLLQALLSYFPSTICNLRVKPYYDGHLMVRDRCMFDKVFWAFPSCVKAFNHCKPFVSVDGTHLYGRYSGLLLIAVEQDGNINILPIAFAIVESESTESWSFFLANLRRHITPQDDLLAANTGRPLYLVDTTEEISDRSKTSTAECSQRYP
ncbi:uncharacterized protein LOC127741500 [Arachis duranensis]|uniref:Uncharacterized protein LOC127741500 n=1 Tax=Arachis duranensis TaxID=130453 RepID=A0A9C6WLC8_ARADU|nr:uncharacterized protein LOC127741500 [Arachis duranensis]